MSFIYNWFIAQKTISPKEEDLKYRLEVSERLINLLFRMKNEGVQTRNHLKKYIGYFEEDGRTPSPEKSQIEKILIRVGWLPLDPYYYGQNDDSIEKEKWLTTKMILTDYTINYAISALLEPNNITWCYCLSEDFIEKSEIIYGYLEDYQI
ncbi:MAG: hypothetical protein WD512_14160 [Candidatus Paceibacterota bacterium]